MGGLDEADSGSTPVTDYHSDLLAAANPTKRDSHATRKAGNIENPDVKCAAHSRGKID